MTHRFDVDYKERLKQRQEASNAYRLPRLGYELYRIYAIEEPKEYKSFTMTVSKGRQSGKTQANWQQVLWAFIDEFESKTTPPYEVKWLKPKQATLLRMRGHRVEPAEPGDTVGHVGPIKTPVRLGR